MVEAPPAPGGPSVGPPPASGDRRPTRATVARSLAVLVALAIALLWIWALVVGSQTPPGVLDDREFVAQADEICQGAAARLAELPPAYEATSAVERAAVVDRSNEILGEMVSELRAIAPTEGDDAGMVDGWLADWEQYVEDRGSYADRLREDEMARFYVTERDGDQVTEPVGTLAEVNGMGACATPNDLS